jgi:hypothetical protein
VSRGDFDQARLRDDHGLVLLPHLADVLIDRRRGQVLPFEIN